MALIVTFSIASEKSSSQGLELALWVHTSSPIMSVVHPGAQVASERLSFAVSASQSPPLNDWSLVTAGIADSVADERVRA